MIPKWTGPLPEVERRRLWAEQVKILPNRALETLVRDERGLHVQPVSLQLSESVKGRWREHHQLAHYADQGYRTFLTT